MKQTFKYWLIRSLALLVSIWIIAAMTSCGDTGGGGGGSNSANFSEYYPLNKGAYRTYIVTGPGIGTKDRTEVWTNGAIYDGYSSTRTSASDTEWYDEVYVNGQVLLYDEVDAEGNYYEVYPPAIKGIDNWQSGQTVSSSGIITINGVPYPFKLDVTYVGIESITVPAGTFSDCMKVYFSFFDGAVTGTSWYARGVGLIREIYADGETWELKSHGLI